MIDTWAKASDGHTITAQFVHCPAVHCFAMSREGGTRTRGPSHRLINLIRNRLAAWAFLRLCFRISSTSPFASTDRQSQCLRPRIEITTSSRRHLSAGTGRSRRILAAICFPNRCHYTRMLSYETISPRSSNRSSFSRILQMRCQATQHPASSGQTDATPKWHRR